MAQVRKSRVLLSNVRASFVQLAEPKGFNGSEPAYSANFLIAYDDKQVEKIKAAIEDLVKQQWPVNPPALKADKIAFKDGNQVTYTGYADHYYVTSKNRLKPSLKHLDLSDLEDPNEIQSGDYVNACIEFWAQDNNYGKRINCNLVGVQFIKQGERFSGASGDVFVKVVNKEEEEILDIFKAEEAKVKSEKPKLAFGSKL